MIKRSIITGLLVGVLFTLVAFYPVLLLYSRPEIVMPRLPVGMRPVLLILSGVLGLAVLPLVGGLAAWRTGASDLGRGFKAGAISGLIVGVMFYVLVLAPTDALAASARMWIY
ncbi:MAG: hypothetical protein PVF47_12555, partial [Anaerolineae bacterium]